MLIMYCIVGELKKELHNGNPRFRWSYSSLKGENQEKRGLISSSWGSMQEIERWVEKNPKGNLP